VTSPERGVGAPADADEERRYREVGALDAADDGGVATLLAHLDDPSWRVRRAATDRIATGAPAAVVPPLVAALAPGITPGRRTAAEAALVQIGAPAVPALLAALAAPAPVVRTAAAEVLGDVGDRNAVAGLTARLADSDANTRAAAAEALGKVGGAAAIAALEGALSARDEALRRAALDALTRLRAPPPADVLAELARDRALRRSAVRAAGASDDPRALALLAGALADRSRAVREAALAGLGQRRLRGDDEALGDALRVPARALPQAVEAALAALDGDDVAVRVGALALLGATGDPRHAPALARAADDERVSAAAVDALAALGDGLGEALAPVLGDLAPAGRAAALSALARRGDARVLPELVAALASEDEAARGPAVEALGRLGDPAAADALGPLLEHGDASVSGAAAAALAELAARGEAARARVLAAARARQGAAAAYRLLGRVGAEEDLPALRAGLRASHRGTRVAAAGALAAIASRVRASACDPELVDALDDPDAAVRAAAAQAVGALARGGAALGPGAARVLRALAASLRDEEHVVRAAAAQALGRCRAAEYRAALAALASDPTAQAEPAAAAVHALAEIGDPDCEVLARAARHPDAEVVKEAVRAAAGLPGAAAARLLLDAAAHARWDVRRAAAAALAARGDRALLEPVRRLAAAEEDPLVAEALHGALEALGTGRSP
jgi:HEAT repeat protein